VDIRDYLYFSRRSSCLPPNKKALALITPKLGKRSAAWS
jgi:hypothetical protein